MALSRKRKLTISEFRARLRMSFARDSASIYFSSLTLSIIKKTGTGMHPSLWLILVVFAGYFQNYIT